MYEKQDYNSLIQAILPTTKVNGALAFVPTIANEAIFPDYITRAAARNFNKLLTLISNNYTSCLFKFVNEIDGEVAQSELFWDTNDHTFECTAAMRATSARYTMLLPGRYKCFGGLRQWTPSTHPDSGDHTSGSVQTWNSFWWYFRATGQEMILRTIVFFW